MPRPLIILIYICFFLSGVAGLIYEVVWARQLSLFLGITGYAHTAVITAYMAGLAAGAWYFGKRSDQIGQPLKLYAYLEIGVALYAATTPWLFSALQSAYAGIAGVTGVVGTPGHLARFSIALAALLVPTFLMGGTLPLLVRGVTGIFSDLGKTTSRLYGINTLGAMSGTLFAGYVLIQQFGITATIFVGVTINLAIAALVLIALRDLPVEEQAEVSVTTTSGTFEGGPRLTILIGFAAAGFAALITQLAWIRVLVLTVGGSVYAFTIALASFLAGIGIGSLIYNWIFHGSEKLTAIARLPQAAVIAGLAGFTILAGVPLLAQLPEWFMTGFTAGLHNNFALFQAYIFGLAFALMFLPTLFMGVLFPLVTVIWTRHFASAGQGVGTAYAVNTTGTILGALLGGLVILPWLGIQHSLVLAAVIYIMVAVTFWVCGTRSFSITSRSVCPLGSIVVFAVSAWYLPAWDSVVWGNGVFYRPDNTLEEMKEMSLHDVMAQSRLLYYEEGIDGTVVVSADDEQNYLVINGKTDATSVGDLQTQLLLGHLPALFHEDARNALIIGLGSGITAGAVAAHDNIEEIIVLEILPEVVEASEFFVEENQHVLEDPRVNLVTADARNYLLSSDQAWDLIISEPSNPWVSGVSNLFTRDFFKLAKTRLAPQGIMTQWFHAYSMSTADFKSVLRTFAQSFNYVTVWNVQLGDILLVGSDEPHTLDLERFAQAQAHEKIGYDLDRGQIPTARELMRMHLLSGEQLVSFLAGAEINTDDRPVIEFNAPRNLYAETTLANMRAVASHVNGKPALLPVTGMAKAAGAGLRVLAMNLDISFPNPAAVSAVRVEWLIQREPLIQDGEDYFGIGSSRQLSWQDAQSSRRVQAIWLEEKPDPGVFDTLLDASLNLTTVRNGDISMHGGNPGRWMTAEHLGRMEVGIMWVCPHPTGGFTRYFAYSAMPDPGEPLRGEELIILASQFRCWGVLTQH